MAQPKLPTLTANSPGFGKCPSCRCPVLWGQDPVTAQWGWMTPALGYRHVCGTNCACREVTVFEEGVHVC